MRTVIFVLLAALSLSAGPATRQIALVDGTWESKGWADILGGSMNRILQVAPACDSNDGPSPVRPLDVCPFGSGSRGCRSLPQTPWCKSIRSAMSKQKPKVWITYAWADNDVG